MEDNDTIKTIKGFDCDLKCRDFQYEVGKTYECEGNIVVCRNGFHAISEDVSPLSVFEYYPPSLNGKNSRYCEVECSNVIKKDSDKVACSQIKIGAEIGIPGIVKAHIEWVKKHLIGDKKVHNTGDQSSASNTGNYSSASNTGDYSSASNTGNYSSAEVSGEESVAIATGYKSKAKGTLGCAIVVAERGDWNGTTYPLIGIKAAIVDGLKIKPDTWYTVEHDEWKEVTNE